MRDRFQVKSSGKPAEANIYADRSSLILNWLLIEAPDYPSFSLREVASQVGVSLGLVQRVFTVLVAKGLLDVEGVRTAKRFAFNKAKELLESWLDHYSIIKKCKIRTYSSAFSGKEEWFSALKRAGLNQSVTLALHSAAEAYGYKNTNLKGLELYMNNLAAREKLERVLRLEPKERGYDVLLIEPYYKSFINQEAVNQRGILICPLLINFLDLYHFPLRGQEQADFIAKRAPEIQGIYGFSKRRSRR